MTLPPGETSGEDLGNEHAWAEQWLYVVSGTGTARVGARTVKLRAGSLLLIEKREPHRIQNTGRKRLVTLNLYAPPGYAADGEPLPAPRAGRKHSPRRSAAGGRTSSDRESTRAPAAAHRH